MLTGFKHPLFIIGFFMLTACSNQTGSADETVRPTTIVTENTRPAQVTNKNEVATSNLNLAVAYMRERSYKKALKKLDKAKEAEPTHSPIYNVYGLLYQQLGQFDKAEKNFKHAISLDKSDSSTLNNYGRFLCQQGKTDAAEKIFLKAIDNPLYETPEIAITNAGLCADKNGDKAKAEIYYRQALKFNPKMPQALLQMCEIVLGADDYLSARGYLQRYKAVARHTAKSLWLGVQIENHLGDKDAVSSYALLLRNSFPDSNETGLLSRSGIR